MNDQYKRQHGPQKYGKTHQGVYIPTRHPEKCLTRENVFRSSWEWKFFEWCDQCPDVIRWASEPIGIKYLNPVKNLEYCHRNNLDPMNPRNQKVSTYYTDVWIELKTSTGDIRRIFIEIKPESQAIPPQPLPPNPTRKQIKKFNDESSVFLVNQAKWAAAKAYFSARGAEFQVFTEREFAKLGIPL